MYNCVAATSYGMNKGNKGRKLGRKRDQRKALLKGLGEALILHERILTTEAKAKELRPFVEHMITKARSGSIAARRLIAQHFSPTVTKKLVDTIAPRYTQRPGGYTRIVKREARAHDAAKQAFIEFVK